MFYEEYELVKPIEILERIATNIENPVSETT